MFSNLVTRIYEHLKFRIDQYRIKVGYRNFENILNSGERYDPLIYSSMHWKDNSHFARYNFAQKYISENESVLDIACGSGYGTKILASSGNAVTGVDISEIAIKYAKKQYQDRNISFENSDFFSYIKSFDIVITFETIEHLKNSNFKVILNKLLSLTRDKIIGSVPYKEKQGVNLHHSIFGLQENNFKHLKSLGRIKFFYQAPDGKIYSRKSKKRSVQNLLFVFSKKLISKKQKKHFPLVSIITPVYNRASYVEETIKSVLSQDYPRIEYIVLDDGSTDDSVKVIKKFKRRIIWDSHKNMGETKTVNKGFKMAQGEIIGVVNSDDPLLPGAISEIVKFIRDNPELIVVYPDWKQIDQKGRVLENVKTRDYEYDYMVRKHFCTPGPGAFFRKKVVEVLKGRDSQFKYVGDFDFWLRAGLLGPFARLPKTLAKFRVHPDSASVKQKGSQMAKEHSTLINKFFSHPNLPIYLNKYKSEAYCYAYLVGSVTAGNNHFLKLRYLITAFYFYPILFFQLIFLKLAAVLLKK